MYVSVGKRADEFVKRVNVFGARANVLGMRANALSLCAVALLAALATTPVDASASASKIAPAARATLKQYLDALTAQHYTAAFGILASKDRAYFRSVGNFASIFAADEFHLELRIRSPVRARAGRSATSCSSPNTFAFSITRIKSRARPSRPSRTDCCAPAGSTTCTIRIIPGKLRPPGTDAPQRPSRTASYACAPYRCSAQRVEVLLTFTNLHDGFVTLLPYGRSVLRDDRGVVAHPIATKLSQLTDKQLYLGLRLAGHARYTGLLSFQVATAPLKSATLTLAPFLRDGADAPFEVVLPAISLP